MLRSGSDAFGAPGIKPTWARGDKDGVGTAYRSSSRVWFTIWNGIITEVYYPHVDTPQLRDLRFIFTDGSTFCHDELHEMSHRIEFLGDMSMGYRIISEDVEKRFTFIKEIITDNYSPSLLVRCRFVKGERWNDDISCYLVASPHLDGEGQENDARVVTHNYGKLLVAERNSTFMVVNVSTKFSEASAGYVGFSDGHTDLTTNMHMTFAFESALAGNVALTGRIIIPKELEFVVCVSFANSEITAIARMNQSLSMGFEQHLSKFLSTWNNKISKLLDLSDVSRDGGRLFRASYCIIMAHEDKTHEGGVIASLSIPWGEISDDSNRGGYHLIWSRDLVNAATGLIAAGDVETPLRSLIYLDANQRTDGSFPQNFWIDGSPYWNAVQLDQSAYPILLAYKLARSNALKQYDPRPMVYKAAAFLIKSGPVTQQDRWEENSGFSAATIAVNIAAMVCASCFARNDNRPELRDLFLSYADFLERNLERWCSTKSSNLFEDIKEHYIRINPADFDSNDPDQEPDGKLLLIKNLPYGGANTFPANSIVSTGFLQLVRYGIRSPEDPLIVNSVKIIDRLLKVDTPNGPTWHRYNHDGYGQNDDGSGFSGTGSGRGWPLLTGERAHYELSCGRSVDEYIRAMENFASETKMLPEQVWTSQDLPEKHLFLGKKTGSATPLVWAHSEYIKLLRSVKENSVFDQISEVRQRYIDDRSNLRTFEIWKLNRQLKRVSSKLPLRVILEKPFFLEISTDNGSWTSQNSIDSGCGLFFTDIDLSTHSGKTLCIKMNWLDGSHNELSTAYISVEE